ncbi:MAG: type II secretion system F family protein [Candidatus Wildermuthbacteria bacterium]|nr:type II secretion system F family protein [Candidatus Wildermuthbacteria bacterium]
MPFYSYNAVSDQGQKVSGQENAKDEQELARLLRGQGLALVSASTGKTQTKKSGLNLSLKISLGVPLKAKLMFIRNLRVMISSGVALPRALQVLSEQSENPIFEKTIREIKDEIMKGTSLSDSMARYPKIFSEIFTNMIKVGEESGTLEDVLKNLEIQLEKQNELHSRVVGALMYPAVVVTAMLGIGIMMLVVVVPTLAQTFKDLGVELPFTTRMIISLGEFMAQRWYVVIVLFIAFITGVIMGSRTSLGKRFFDTFVLKAPIASGIMHKTGAAITLRTLSSLIASGVPIVRCLEITSRVLNNSYYRDALAHAAEEVRKGARLSSVLSSYSSLYPLLVVQMIEVGEETGESSQVLGKLAEFFEDEVAQITQNLASVLEPILMLLIGGVVGLFAISMIQPMYSMLGSLQ